MWSRAPWAEDQTGAFRLCRYGLQLIQKPYMLQVLAVNRSMEWLFTASLPPADYFPLKLKTLRNFFRQYNIDWSNKNPWKTVIAFNSSWVMATFPQTPIGSCIQTSDTEHTGVWSLGRIKQRQKLLVKCVGVALRMKQHQQSFWSRLILLEIREAADGQRLFQPWKSCKPLH